MDAGRLINTSETVETKTETPKQNMYIFGGKTENYGCWKINIIIY